jgi:hypothetical protein
MKKILLLIFVILLFIQVRSQDQKTDQETRGEKFFIGLSYSYMSFDMKLKALSLHSVWAGQDLGTRDLSTEEIDDLNSFTEQTTTVNTICLEAGFPLLNKPNSKWYMDGTLILGIAQTEKRRYNKNSETEEYASNSGFSKPCFGLEFNIAYQFNQSLGLALRPLFTATMGTTSGITDNINLVPENFTQSLEDKYSTFYERVSLLGSFSAGNISLYAGPGFYWINSNHEYTIVQSNMSNGNIIREELNSKGIARSCFDGNIALEWNITNSFTFYAHAGFGNDIFINTGIHLNF